MILQFNYEELTALKSGATGLLREDVPADGSVLAPPEKRARVEALVGMLDGDLSLDSLAEVHEVQEAVDSIVAWLRQEMESAVVATHAADESAVAAYFDFAHAFTVSHRISEMASEMTALIELMTGASPTAESARDIHFPD
ncbi:MAG: hypothetical protein U5R14_14025 [Gemmatimonadota bacterium]|nr:hypothetical protein [Gemmatimonadota bacterium]